MAGYSGTPLAKKLGIEEDRRVGLFEAPDGFETTLAPLPEGAELWDHEAFAIDETWSGPWFVIRREHR